MVRHPRGSCIVHSVLLLEVATPENKSVHSTLSFKIQKVLPHRWFLLGCSSPFLRLAQHLTALRAWCKKFFLVNESPMCSVPALQGCEGLWSYDYRPYMT